MTDTSCFFCNGTGRVGDGNIVEKCCHCDGKGKRADQDAKMCDPLGYRWTQHWCIEWACGHLATPIADRAPEACPTCGCTDEPFKASYPVRVQA